MSNGQKPTDTDELEPINFTCYRISPEDEGALEEGVNTYSVMVLLPNGMFRHQIVWARNPEDIEAVIHVLPGTRVIMTQMANHFIWDNRQAEERERPPEAVPTPR
ncbi:MAG: hypothetical protein KO206_00105 [Methanomicrobiaceae archaeon]|uniref:Uncharacterized protein n=1 Tax=hydrocarbon metagenome TaxID=938273 RepID=A0A0W8FJP6_9ZZZZ|nr:hypothetical protein [Methanomicrobiaceae archaeon]MDD5418929.1 hypothetical protein [Methanomicrobiaceae archaeon]